MARGRPSRGAGNGRGDLGLGAEEPVAVTPSAGITTAGYAASDATPVLPYDVDAAGIMAALEGFASIGQGNVEVTGTGAGRFQIWFLNDITPPPLTTITSGITLSLNGTPVTTSAGLVKAAPRPADFASLENIQNIEGGQGDDLLIGSAGANIFSFRNDWGNDIVVGNGGSDTLDFSNVDTDVTYNVLDGNQNLSIDVHHVNRIEGHGNIEVSLKKGTIEKCSWNVVEAPRFFEAFLQGRPFKDVNHITSRICGICSIGHQMASLKATEAAMGVKISEQTRLLRKLLLHGENLQSHALHTYFLVAPDFFGVGSVFPLVKTHPNVVVRALTLKKLANDLCDVVGGRTVHPIRCKVGGFSCLPKISELEQTRARLEAARPEIDKTAELFATLKIPAFERETEYVAISCETEYPLYEGTLCTSDAGTFKDKDYLAVTNENIVPQSTAERRGVRPWIAVAYLTKTGGRRYQR